MKIKFLLFGFFVFMLIDSSCSLKAIPTDGIYLIPKGYVGDVIILFNQSNGVTPETENGLYVYKIPENGILKVKTPGVASRVNLSYFYVDENNQRQMIEYLRITGERDPSGKPQNKFGNISEGDYEKGVFIMNSGGLGSFNAGNDVIQYTSFIIGSPKENSRLYNKMLERISDLHREYEQNS